MEHQQYIDALKSTALSVGKDAVMKVLITKFPFLAWGPLGPLVALVVEKLLNILIKETEFAIFFKYIDLRVDNQGRLFSEAAIKNYQIQKTGTEEEKRISEEDLKNKFKSFVVLGN